ncbi:MAG: metal-dependent transcriptional regulator, partial [Nocardioidaceae bacterium]
MTKTQAPTSVIEDYVKGIYHLEGEAAATTTLLAARLGVTASSASAMVKRLDAMGLAAHAPYRGVRLTRQGRRLALSVVRRHRLLELFLTES